MHNYLIFGIQGAGKGTQAGRIAKRMNIPHIAMGDVLREAIESDTPLGREAKSYLDAGNLVPDDLIMPFIQDRLSQPDCETGFILDGFPRKLSQAEKFDEVLNNMGRSLTAAILIEISDADLMSRLESRKVCASCGSVYSMEVAPPRISDQCDRCGGELIRRKDDQDLAAINARVANYHEQTGKAIEHYRALGLLVTINGRQPIEDVYAEILERLGI